MQIFEWWYFRKYGASFIEQVSLNHISPWIGGGEQSVDATPSTSSSCNTSSNMSSQQSVPGTLYNPTDCRKNYNFTHGLGIACVKSPHTKSRPTNSFNSIQSTITNTTFPLSYVEVGLGLKTDVRV